MKKPKKLRKNAIVIYEPAWVKGCESEVTGPLHLGEMVIYLGDIPNCIGHCVVAKHSGQVVWMVHPQDFREATDDEV